MPDIPRDESAGVADRAKEVSAPAVGGTKATQGDSTLHEPQSATTGKPKTGRATASAAKSTPLAVSMEDLGEQIGRGVLNTGRGAKNAVRSAGARARKVAVVVGASGESAAQPNAPSTDARVLSFKSPTGDWAPLVQRAEEVVDDLVERAKPLALVIGLRLRRVVARAREEAEDIWAEAESLRALGRAADDASARSNASDSRSAPDLTLGQTDKRPGDPA